MSDMSIGQQIKEARIKKGFTLRALAKKVGVSHVILWLWEEGKTQDMGLKKFSKVMKALDLKYDDVMDSEKNNQNNLEINKNATTDNS